MREMHTSDFRHIRAWTRYFVGGLVKCFLGRVGSFYLAVFQLAKFLLGPKPLTVREAYPVEDPFHASPCVAALKRRDPAVQVF